MFIAVKVNVGQVAVVAVTIVRAQIQIRRVRIFGLYRFQSLSRF